MSALLREPFGCPAGFSRHRFRVCSFRSVHAALASSRTRRTRGQRSVQNRTLSRQGRCFSALDRLGRGRSAYERDFDFRADVRGRSRTGHRLIAVYEYTPFSQFPNARFKSIAITQQNLSVQEVKLRIWLPKNLLSENIIAPSPYNVARQYPIEIRVGHQAPSGCVTEDSAPKASRSHVAQTERSRYA
jgi:hypothetical protein